MSGGARPNPFSSIRRATALALLLLTAAPVGAAHAAVGGSPMESHSGPTQDG